MLFYKIADTITLFFIVRLLLTLLAVSFIILNNYNLSIIIQKSLVWAYRHTFADSRCV